ncbi:MAG: hypothetical protein IIA87_05795 [Nanoarchaeota archaeon]|nr:hypothetical protein [Nanoarchaeota archaeon]
MVVLAHYRHDEKRCFVEFENESGETISIPLEEICLKEGMNWVINPTKIEDGVKGAIYKPMPVNEALKTAAERGGDYIILTGWGSYFVLTNKKI